jgi:hypothetical protein
MPRDVTKPREVPPAIKKEREVWIRALTHPSQLDALVERIKPAAANSRPGFWKSEMRHKKTGVSLHFVFMKTADGFEAFADYHPEEMSFDEACELLVEQTILHLGGQPGPTSVQ